MRAIRTNAENRIVERLPPVLVEHGIETPAIDPNVTDAPDVLVQHAQGRLGAEISRLDYQSFCEWHAYDRVLFNLDHPNRWYSLYRKGYSTPRQSHVTRWPTVILNEAAIVTNLGVNAIDLGDKPNRPLFE